MSEDIDLRELSDRDLLIRIATKVESHGHVQADHETRIRAGELAITRIQQQDETREKDKVRVNSALMLLSGALGALGHWVAGHFGGR